MIHVIQINVTGHGPARHAVLEDNTIVQLRTNRDDGPDPIVFPGTPHHAAVIAALRDRLSALQCEGDQIERVLEAVHRLLDQADVRIDHRALALRDRLSALQCEGDQIERSLSELGIK